MALQSGKDCMEKGRIDLFLSPFLKKKLHVSQSSSSFKLLKPGWAVFWRPLYSCCYGLGSSLNICIKDIFKSLLGEYCCFIVGAEGGGGVLG